jgi:predicted AAA+ superfamily ATPase
MVIRQQLPRALKPPSQSFFLFGPRGSGKSTWIRQHFAKSVRLDLLDEALFHELLTSPGRFADRLRGLRARSWVCVDEIQRLPTLLNEVHRSIETAGLRFVLSGSSARKLKREGVNLLAGRALRKSMHPFLPSEMEGRFRIDEALRFGTLPIVLASSSPEETLGSYVLSYLRDEIQAEALARSLAGFSRFLPIAALMHGQTVNVSSLARDSGVARTTVADYLDVLEDTLLAFRLPAFEAKLRVRERKHPKLYWVDAGVVRAAKQHRGPVAPEERGPLFEGIVATLLRAWNDYRGVYDAWAYWAPAEGAPVEVDFLLRRGKRFIAIEVKSSPRPRDDDRAGLDAIDGLPGLERRIIVYPRSATLRLHGGIEVFDLEAFEALVATGKL